MPVKYYSVYNRNTGLPVAIHFSALECSKAMGVKLKTFRSYVCRIRTGQSPSKWEIYLEKDDDDG